MFSSSLSDLLDHSATVDWALRESGLASTHRGHVARRIATLLRREA
jgi:hypothetical protein